MYTREQHCLFFEKKPMENEPEGNFSALETAWTNDSVNVSTGLFVCLCIYLFFTTEYNIMRFLNSLKN